MKKLLILFSFLFVGSVCGEVQHFCDALESLLTTGSAIGAHLDGLDATQSFKKNGCEHNFNVFDANADTVVSEIINKWAQKQKVSFAGAMLTKANLTGLDFSKNGVDFSGATDMSGVVAKNVNFGSGSSFKNRPLFNADFTGATCVGCDFSNTGLGGINLTNANLSNSTIVPSQISVETINDLRKAIYIDSSGNKKIGYLKGTLLNNVKMQGVNLSGLALDDVDLSGADCANVNFTNVKFLNGTNLGGGANFSGATFSGNTIDPTVNYQGAIFGSATIGSRDMAQYFITNIYEGKAKLISISGMPGKEMQFMHLLGLCSYGRAQYNAIACRDYYALVFNALKKYNDDHYHDSSINVLYNHDSKVSSLGTLESGLSDMSASFKELKEGSYTDGIYTSAIRTKACNYAKKEKVKGLYWACGSGGSAGAKCLSGDFNSCKNLCLGDKGNNYCIAMFDIAQTMIPKPSFAGLNFHGLVLSNSNISGLDFTNAIFYKTSLYNVNAGSAVFNGANMNTSYMGGGNFAHAKFKDADLTNAYLYDSRFKRSDFKFADLRVKTMAGADARATFYDGADMRINNVNGVEGTWFTNSYFRSGAKLYGKADWSLAKSLYGIDLSSAILVDKNNCHKGQADVFFNAPRVKNINIIAQGCS